MSNQLYDILNKIQRWMYALGAFYIGLCAVWGFPFGDEVNKTLALVATLLAATLEISTANYRKNQLEQSNRIDGDPRGGEDEDLG